MEKLTLTLCDIGPKQQPNPKAMRMLANQLCLSADAKEQIRSAVGSKNAQGWRALGDEGPKVSKSAAMHFVVLITYIPFNSSII